MHSGVKVDTSAQEESHATPRLQRVGQDEEEEAYEYSLHFMI